MGRARKDIRAWQEAFRQCRSVDWAERWAGRQRSRGSPRLGGASPFPVDLGGDTDYLRPPFRKGATGGVEGGGLHCMKCGRALERGEAVQEVIYRRTSLVVPFGNGRWPPSVPLVDRRRPYLPHSWRPTRSVPL